MLANLTSNTVIAVTDIERARQFYIGTLGLTHVRDVAEGFVAGAGGAHILVYTSGSAGSAQNTVLGWDVSADEFDAVIADLRGRGVVFEDYDFGAIKTVDGVAAFGDVRSAWFKDPDGNTLAVSTPM